MLALSAEKIADQVMAFVTAHIAWIEPIVFLLGMGESLIVVSFFIPSTILFIAIGGLYAAADGPLWQLCLAGAAGAFVGDVVSYAGGRYFKNDITKFSVVRKNRRVFARTRLFCQQWGSSGVIISKFMGMFRSIVPIVAGVLSMPAYRFIPASAVSCLIWATAFLSPGYGVSWFMGSG